MLPTRRALPPILALLALATALAVPAGAVEEPSLGLDDLLPGTCSPSPVVVGQSADCRFPLVRDAAFDPFGGPYVADVDGSYDDQFGTRGRCSLEGGELVCRGVPTFYPAGTTRVRVQLGWLGTTGVLAEIETLAEDDVPVVLSVAGASEPYTTAHRPLRLWVDREGIAGLQAAVRTRDGGDPVAVLPIPATAVPWEQVSVDVSGLPPGRYALHPCLPREDGPAACDEVPGVAWFQVGTGLLEEVVPGANRPGADRINLVLAGTGFADVEDFRETAAGLLGLDGPTLLDDEGRPTGGTAAAVEWGPFATEPLRTYRDRFNLWLLGDLVADSHALFWLEPPNGLGLGPGGTELPDVQITTIELLPPGSWDGSEAGFPSFTGLEPGPPDRDALQFAGAYVALPSWVPLTETDTLTHELGHALFDLRDEYTSFDRSVQHGYPNCAPDLETARAWWGDLEGETDPFLGEYLAVMEEHGQWVPPREEIGSWFEVGYVMGGCYAEVGSQAAVRPTSESIMNGQTPVFGAVNRRRAEEIMELWSGRDLLRTDADLDVGCARSPGDPWQVTCRGVLAPYVDPPEGGISITSAGDGAACRSTAAAGGEPVTVACGPLRVAGYAPVEVAVQGGPGILAEVHLPAVPVAPIGVALGLGGVPPVPREPGGAPPGARVLIGAGAAMAALSAALLALERRRRAR